MTNSPSPSRPRGVSRRVFLRDGTLFLAGWAVAGGAAFASEETGDKPAVEIGLLTDLHYADKPAAGSRFYRQSPGKLREAVEHFKGLELDFVVELGDFVDKAESVKEEITYLKTIDRVFSELTCDRHYVLGNHCVATLTKKEFLTNSGARKAFYSFDASGFHFVILDACFRHDFKPYGRNNSKWNDANVHPAELKWLAADLGKTKKKTIVFIHQRLDVQNNYGVKNAAQVRKILERSGKVLAVFQGHNHINDLKRIGGIHYCTLNAVIEGRGEKNSAYANLAVFGDGSLRVQGFRKQKSYRV